MCPRCVPEGSVRAVGGLASSSAHRAGAARLFVVLLAPPSVVVVAVDNSPEVAPSATDLERIPAGREGIKVQMDHRHIYTSGRYTIVIGVKEDLRTPHSLSSRRTSCETTYACEPPMRTPLTLQIPKCSYIIITSSAPSRDFEE